MKIAMFAAAHKIHAHRWSRWLAGRGHEVVLFSDTPPPEHLDYTGIRRIAPRWTLWRNLLVFKLQGGPHANNRHKWRAYRDQLLDEKPDLIHAQEALAYGPTLAHLPADIPKVLTPWGPDMESLRGKDREVGELVRLAVRSADVITTNAPGLEDHWSALSGVERERFRLFSWGIDRKVFHRRGGAERRAMAGALGLPADARLLLSPRLARAYCRIDLILRAWKRALPSLPEEARLVVLRAGAAGPDWLRWQELAREEAIGRVHFVDRLFTPEEMAVLYSLASGTVMVPLTDLVAMSLLEALACGSIPLVHGLPCHRSVVADMAEARPGRASGFVAREAGEEALAGLITRWGGLDGATLEEMGRRNGDFIARHHDWEKNAPILLDVYREAEERCAARRG